LPDDCKIQNVIEVSTIPLLTSADIKKYYHRTRAMEIAGDCAILLIPGRMEKQIVQANRKLRGIPAQLYPGVRAWP